MAKVASSKPYAGKKTAAADEREAVDSPRRAGVRRASVAEGTSGGDASAVPAVPHRAPPRFDESKRRWQSPRKPKPMPEALADNSQKENATSAGRKPVGAGAGAAAAAAVEPVSPMRRSPRRKSLQGPSEEETALRAAKENVNDLEELHATAHETDNAQTPRKRRASRQRSLSPSRTSPRRQREHEDVKAFEKELDQELELEPQMLLSEEFGAAEPTPDDFMDSINSPFMEETVGETELDGGDRFALYSEEETKSASGRSRSSGNGQYWLTRSTNELSSFLASRASLVSQASARRRGNVWNWVKTWMAQSIIPNTVELTKTTVESAKTIISTATMAFAERVNRASDQKEPNHEIEARGAKRARLEQVSEPEESAEVRAEEVVGTENVELASQPFDSMNVLGSAPVKVSTVLSEAIESRLTEIVLFLARCDASTPLADIYERLGEFFELKGGSALNFTERQLVLNVTRAFLLQGEQVAKDADVEGDAFVDADRTISKNVLPEAQMAAEALQASSLNLKRCGQRPFYSAPARFKAPTFTDLQDEDLAAERGSSRVAPPSASLRRVPQFKKKRVVSPDRTLTMLESLISEVEMGSEPAAFVTLADGTTAQMEMLISRKMDEARKKTDEERREAERLRIRVIELERDLKEQRALKEAALQNAKSVSSASVFDFGGSKEAGKHVSFAAEVQRFESPIVPSLPVLNPDAKPFEAKPLAGLSGFGMSSAFGQPKEKQEAVVSALPSVGGNAPLPTFQFGVAKQPEAKPVNVVDAKPVFAFGMPPSDAKPGLFESKPSDAKSGLFEPKPSDAKPGLFEPKPSDAKLSLFETTPSDTKPLFAFGMAAPSNGAKSEDSKPTDLKPAFSFGTAPVDQKPLSGPAPFTFGAPLTESKPALPSFNFAAAEPTGEAAAKKRAFDFGLPTKANESASIIPADTGKKPFAQTSFTFEPTASADNTAKPAFSADVFSFPKPAVGKDESAAGKAAPFGAPFAGFGFSSQAPFGSAMQAAPAASAASFGFGAQSNPPSDPFASVFASSLGSSNAASQMPLFNVQPNQTLAAAPLFPMAQSAPAAPVSFNFGSSTAPTGASDSQGSNRSYSVPKRRLARK